MIREITETIATIFREIIKSVPKSSITIDEVNSGKGKAPPSVVITSPEFTVEEFSLAGSEPEKKEVQEERFNGDGKANEFILSQKPLRPLLLVEHPLGEERGEPEDYSVDYSAAKITFRTPPSKGKSNVLVRFRSVKSSGELRNLQLNLKYIVKVNAENGSQRDEITLDALKALVFAKEALERKGVAFNILGGRNDAIDHEAASRQIECIAHTKLIVEMPAGAMEKILIHMKP